MFDDQIVIKVGPSFMQWHGYGGYDMQIAGGAMDTLPSELWYILMH